MIHSGISYRGELETHPNGEKSFLFDIWHEGKSVFIRLSLRGDPRFMYYDMMIMLGRVTTSILADGVPKISKHKKICDIFHYATGGFDTNIRVHRYPTN